MQRFVVAVFLFLKEHLNIHRVSSQRAWWNCSLSKVQKNDKLFDISLKNEAYIIRLGSAPAIKAEDGAD